MGVPYEVAEDKKKLIALTQAFADNAARQGAKLQFESDRGGQQAMTPEEAIARLKAYKGKPTDAGYPDESAEAMALPFYYSMQYPTVRKGILESYDLKSVVH